MNSRLALGIGVGLLAILFGLGLAYCRKKNSSAIKAKYGPAQESGESRNNAHNAAIETRGSQSDPSKGDKETAKEKRNEFRECLKIYLEVVGLIGLLFYAGLTALLWKEAHQQTIDSARAWVGYQQTGNSNLPVVMDKLEIVPKLDIEWHYTIENFGDGPAIKVMPEGWVTPGTGHLKDIASDAEFVCDTATKFATGTVPLGPRVHNPGPMGFVLFPHQTYTDDTFSPSRSNSPLTSAWTGAALPNLKWIFIMGCVAYVDQFKAPHWTRFVVQIGNGRDPVSLASPMQLYSLFNDTDETGSNNRQQ